MTVKLLFFFQLDVKTTKGGAITITKTTKGQVLLTTKKKTVTTSPKKSPNGLAQTRNLPSSNKNVLRNVGRGGVVSLTTRPKQESTFKNIGRGRSNALPRNNIVQPRSGSTVGGRPVLMARDRGVRDDQQLSPRKLTRTIKGELSDAAKLDMELLNTRVNPVSMKIINSNVMCITGISNSIFTACFLSNYLLRYLQRTFRQDIERERERRQREHFREREKSPIELSSLSRSFRSGGARRISPDVFDERRIPRAVKNKTYLVHLEHGGWVRWGSIGF